MNSILEIKEGIQRQTSDEVIIYDITTTNWMSSPTVGTVVVYDESDDDTVVTDTVMPLGSHIDSGDVITLKPLKLLTVDHSYRIEVQFSVGSSTYECFFRVKCIQ